jgi:transposase InsO family protein
VTLHRNARTCPASRRLIARRVLEEGWALAEAAEAAGVSAQRAREWVRRFRAGDCELADRRSGPRRRPPGRVCPEREAVIAELRGQVRMNAVQIAEALGMSERTVRAVIGRLGLSKLAPLEAPEPANRYERPRPGELIHVDVKKLGKIGRPGHRVNGDRATRSRGIGWEFVHVCVDDCTRLAYVEVLDDERKETVTAFLQRAVAWFADQGVIIERLMTDNGPGYRSKLHRKACQALGIRHIFTRPYRPRTNGKAERFIRTLLDGWAYKRPYTTSAERRAALAAFLTRYNTQRPHRSLNGQTPAQRLAERNKTAAAYS